MHAEGGVLAPRALDDLALGELDLNAGRGKPSETCSGYLRRGVSDRADDARDPGGDQGVRAGRLVTVVRARLERDVGRCTAGVLRACRERVRLGVQLARADVPALAEGASVAGDQAADYGVRRGRPAPPLGELERALQELRVALLHGSSAPTLAASARNASPGDGWR